MADIATEAGVHKMTVSRALRDSPEISKEMREKIVKIAQKLGYQKSPLVSTVMGQMAQARRVKHATPLMFLVDKPLDSLEGDPYLRQLIKGARDRAEALGFSLEVEYYRETGKYDARLNTILETRNIQGLVINVAYRQPRRLDLNWDRLSAVTTGGKLLGLDGIPRVQSDVPDIIQRTIREATQRGYKRLGFHYSHEVQETLGNYIRAFIADYHKSIPKKNVIPPIEALLDDKPSRFTEWYKKYKPDVIISSFENVLDWAAEGGLKLRTPEDIGFACFGINEFDSPLSGFCQDKAHLTERAVELVVSNMVNGRFGISELRPTVLVPGIWRDGSTLRPRPQ